MTHGASAVRSLPSTRARVATVPALLAAALAVRLYLAVASPYFWDEIYDWVVVARSISLDPAGLHLPVHDGQHPSLPAYFMRAGTGVLGDAPIAYRLGSVIAGVTTVWLVYLFGQRWFGERSGLVAAALLTFNEYHVGVSALATEKPYYLLFLLAAAFACGEFCRTGARRHACISAGLLGLATLSKYLSLLLIPVFFAATLVARLWDRCHPRTLWLPAAIFLSVVAPDVAWNISHPNTTGSSAANLGDHLGRIGGLGLSRQPLVFYLRDIRNAIYPLVGLNFEDPAAEYPAMNAVMGTLLLGGVIVGTAWYVRTLWRELRPAWPADPTRFAAAFLGVWFWLVFLFFSSIRPGSPKPGIDALAWFWIDSTLFPAVLLVGHGLAHLEGWWSTRAAALTVGVGAALTVMHVVQGYDGVGP